MLGQAAYLVTVLIHLPVFVTTFIFIFVSFLVRVVPIGTVPLRLVRVLVFAITLIALLVWLVSIPMTICRFRRIRTVMSRLIFLGLHVKALRKRNERCTIGARLGRLGGVNVRCRDNSGGLGAVAAMRRTRLNSSSIDVGSHRQDRDGAQRDKDAEAGRECDHGGRG